MRHKCARGRASHRHTVVAHRYKCPLAMPHARNEVYIVHIRWRGFSLTELMVATTLLATVTAGAVTAFTRAHAARRDAGQLQQLHERAQYVFASFEPELQMAGYFAAA